VALLAVFVGGPTAMASAAPMCNFNVDFTGSGQMLVDVYGSNSTWNPIDFGSSSGYTYDGMAVFGKDTPDPSDDFVRYWFSKSSNDSIYHWAMNSDGPAAVDPVDAIPNPEPGSMVLLGSGLLGLAAMARKRFNQRS
jgi:PEP-CTERM motif